MINLDDPIIPPDEPAARGKKSEAPEKHSVSAASRLAEVFGAVAIIGILCGTVITIARGPALVREWNPAPDSVTAVMGGKNILCDKADRSVIAESPNVVIVGNHTYACPDPR